MHQRGSFLWILAFFLIIYNASCSFDQIAQEIIPTDDGIVVDTSGIDTINTNANCNPDSIYFEKDILPILLSNCALSGCHNASSRQNGVVTDSYNKLVQTVGIKPFEPAKSKLYLTITSKTTLCLHQVK